MRSTNCPLHAPQEYADGGDLLQLLMRHGTRLSERRAVSLVLQPLLRAVRTLLACGSRSMGKAGPATDACFLRGLRGPG